MSSFFAAEAETHPAVEVHALLAAREAAREARRTRRQRRAEQVHGRHRRAQARLCDQLVVGFGLDEQAARDDLLAVAAARGINVPPGLIEVQEVAGTLPRHLVAEIEGADDDEGAGGGRGRARGRTEGDG